MDAIRLERLESMADATFGNLVKAVVDVERRIMVVAGELHADEEALLLSEGSNQSDLWGINLHPADFGTEDFVEFDSMINIRPRQGNRTRSVEDPRIRAAIVGVVGRLVQR